MRILYLHQYFNTPSMSGGTRSYEFARRLVEWGHEVHVVTSWRNPDGKSARFETTESGIRVTWLPVPYSNKMSYRNRIRAFADFAVRACMVSRTIPADLVFATSTPLTIVIPGIFASRSKGVPMVLEVRDLWPDVPIALGALKNPLLRLAATWLERVAYRSATRIVALSSGMCDGITRNGGDRDRITVIPNCCDMELFDPARADPQKFLREHPVLGDRPLVVYAGTLGLANGASYLVKIAHNCLAAESELCIVVVGEGAERDLIHAEAQKLNVLGRNFFLLPACPKALVPSLFAAARVVVSVFLDDTSLQANSANKFFDGLAAGRPIAINYGGWQADLIRSHQLGVVLSPNDIPNAAAQLRALVSDTGQLERCGYAARALAKSQFDRNVLARRFEAVCIDAAASFGRS